MTKTPLISGLMLYGNRINLADVSTGGIEKIIYNVPLGKTFFLVACMLTGNIPIAGGNAILYSKPIVGISANCALLRRTGIGAVEVHTFVANYPIPLKFVNGESIAVILTITGGQMWGAIQGYEIDTALLPTFS